MQLTIDELIILYPDELESLIIMYEILDIDDIYVNVYVNPFGD